jgi:uncharacterized protein YecE (DUF72 family)
MSATATHPLRIATAGWSLPAAHRGAFPAGASLLERYAGVFTAVEVNSSFYRPHRPSTYARWAASVPEGFRFAVKMPRTITHHSAFRDCESDLDRFLDEVAALGAKLGPLLVQTPGSLVLEPADLARFLGGLRQRFTGAVACEPRHASWFTAEADALLTDHRIARVAADPPRAPGAERCGAWQGLAYHRLHGSPEIYTSSYDDGRLGALGDGLLHAAGTAETWCVFDNTKYGHATGDALVLRGRLGLGDAHQALASPAT